MRDVRVGGLGLGASEQVERGRGGGGKVGGGGDVVVVIVGPTGEENLDRSREPPWDFTDPDEQRYQKVG